MKVSEWKPWIKLVDEDIFAGENGSVKWALKQVPKEYKKLYALVLSVAKWHPNQRSDLRGEGECGLCATYRSYSKTFVDDSRYLCRNCPLSQAGFGCMEMSSLFDEAIDELDFYGPSGSVDKLYNVLLRLYVEEFERVFSELEAA